MEMVFKTSMFCVLLFILPLGVLAADEPQQDTQIMCPVMGGPIDKSVSIDYHGGKLYFCCADCIKKFKENAKKYTAKANLELVLTGQAQQTACPLTGKPFDANISTKVAGVDVKFCSSGCLAKVSIATPKEQLEMVFDKDFDKAYTVK
jgi:YHS domain-containing protein